MAKITNKQKEFYLKLNGWFTDLENFDPPHIWRPYAESDFMYTLNAAYTEAIRK